MEERPIDSIHRSEIAAVAQSRLEDALGVGDIATWTVDLSTNRIWADANLPRLFDLEWDGPVDGVRSLFLNAVHPDDIDRVTADFSGAVASGGKYLTEYRIVKRDGTFRWLLSRGKVQVDESGNPQIMRGIVLDITDRKEAEQALVRNEQRFRTIADSMPQIVWTTDPEGNALYFNRRCYEYTGMTVEESLGMGFVNSLHPDDQAKMVEAWQEAWSQGKKYEIEYRIRRHDGVYRWFLGRGEPVRRDDGTIEVWAGTSTDITDLRDAAILARASTIALNTVTDGYITLDRDYKVVYANPAAARMNGKSLESFVGQSHWDEWPQSVGTEIETRYRKAMESRQADRFTYHASHTGRELWLDVRVYPASEEDGGGIHLVCADITETTHQAQRDNFLLELAERFRNYKEPAEVIDDAIRSTGAFLRVSRCVFADININADTSTVHPDFHTPEIASISGVWPLSSYGEFLTGEYMAGNVVVVADIYESKTQIPEEHIKAYEEINVMSFISVPMVHTSELVSVLAVHCTAPREWTIEEVVLLKVIVERTWLTIEVIRQHRALEQELERSRDAARRHAIFSKLVEHSTDFIGYADMNGNALFVNKAGRNLVGIGQGTVGDEAILQSKFPEYFHGEDREIAMTEFIPGIFRDGHGGREIRFRNVQTDDPIWVNCSVFTIDDPETGETTALATITRDIRHQHRLREEEQARAARDSALAKIGAAIRSSLPPDEVQAVAMEALAGALNADRCFYIAIDSNANHAEFGRDYHVPGLAPLQGQFILSSLSLDFGKTFPTNQTLVIADTQELPEVPWGDATIASLSRLQIRSCIAVPFSNERGELGAVLTVAMANSIRHWSPAEVQLTDQMATEIKNAIEASQAQHRQRNIAQQLQDALLPAIPGHLQGLSLASFYRPALDESGVGGDGFDVFQLDNGVSILCIFDVSGKGLKAAAQVATVRNMMRFALYNSAEIANAASALNKTLAKHTLLDGFATLFLCRFDSINRRLTYVNCGQEPGMLRRSGTDVIEMLMPTGPALGAYQEGTYSESIVELSIGDTIALFTDGMTEVGPTRQTMLEIDGLAKIFAASEVTSAEHVMNTLITGAEAFAGSSSNLKDDIAVLIAVVTG